MEDSSKDNPFFGWRMVGIALFADFCVVGFAFQSYPVIQLVLAEEMELSRFLATLTIPGFMLISGITRPEKETPSAAIPKALPVYSRNHLETSFETDRLPMREAPKAIGSTKIIMKAV